MEYVAWYLIITGVCSLSAAGLFCWCGYLMPDLFIHESEDAQDYIDHELAERKRLEEYWIWRREESDG